MKYNNYICTNGNNYKHKSKENYGFRTRLLN